MYRSFDHAVARMEYLVQIRQGRDFTMYGVLCLYILTKLLVLPPPGRLPKAGPLLYDFWLEFNIRLNASGLAWLFNSPGVASRPSCKYSSLQYIRLKLIRWKLEKASRRRTICTGISSFSFLLFLFPFLLFSSYPSPFLSDFLSP